MLCPLSYCGLETWAGVEPAFAALQAAASPLGYQVMEPRARFELAACGIPFRSDLRQSAGFGCAALLHSIS
ncbi:hypothetical protein LCGC14_2884830, partial [marine sediment metagenome]